MAEQSFDRFWAAWPPHKRKVNRAGCLKHWKSKNLHAEAEAIMAGLAVAKSSKDWTKEGGEFIPGPVVWLNQRRWEPLMFLNAGTKNIARPGEYPEEALL